MWLHGLRFATLPALHGLRLAALLALLAVAAPTASAAPLVVAGFGDSITSTTFDGFDPGSYLEYLDPADFGFEDHATPAISSADLLLDLQAYIDGAPSADAIVLMTGTRSPGLC